MKVLRNFLILALAMMATSLLHAQDTSTPTKPPRFSIGGSFGYDQPLFDTPYQQLDYSGHRYFGVQADYRFPSNIGIRLGYANMRTMPNILIPEQIFLDTITASGTTRTEQALNRHFVGLGPSYTFGLGQSRFSLLVAPMAGYSWISGGDALADATPSGLTQVVNTGFDDGVLSAKLDLELDYAVTDNFSITMGLYYMRHFGVHLDDNLDINNMGTMTIAHGENLYDHTVNPYTVAAAPPMVVNISPDKPKCMDLSSVGANLGLRYTFGPRPKKVEPECISCICPNDNHKVVVTVKDGPSKQVIPDADVALKDMQGNIVATGTTNAFGVVDFGALPHNDYVVTGLVYGLETTTEAIASVEFTPNAVIQKEVLYNDLRFILKGTTTNKGTRNAEPNVIVTLTDLQNRAVSQDNTDGEGAFSFRLDQNATYEVVGNKENRLSDIERTSTMGLTRSATLFVNLELGVDNFDCGQGTVLDIKYNYDKWDLITASKFELDRLVRYLQDHPEDQIELSSHTDSRGTRQYNQELSEKRAQSAVAYIISNGISGSRIIAKGFGEDKLLNRCADGVDCSENEHRTNRRTEAKLICK